MKKAENWKCKFVQRKYTFEMPIPRKELSFLKIKYDATQPPLPESARKGQSFETIFGANQSMLELFLIKRKIKGPSWITIKSPKKVLDSARKTWCKFEVEVSDPKDCEVTVEDLNNESPPLSAISMQLKTVRSPITHQNEIAMISFIAHEEVQ